MTRFERFDSTLADIKSDDLHFFAKLNRQRQAHITETHYGQLYIFEFKHCFPLPFINIKSIVKKRAKPCALETKITAA
ncbi:hypothetical protein D9M71_193330 [compost metagenome]